MRANSLQYRHGAMIGLLAAASLSSAGHPIGLDDLLREPVKAEARATVTKEGCSRTAARVATTVKTRRTTVAKSEKADKGFKLFRWLL
jgi:hypothetical protein